MTSALELRQIQVRYGEMLAVQGVDLSVGAGRIHGLIGHNGAGKSTLASVIGGSIQPSAGSVLIDGEPVRFHGPRDAERAGVYVVRQERQIFDDMTVADNVAVGSYPARGRGPFRVADRRRAREAAQAIVDELDPGLDVAKPAREATLAQCKLIQVARALYSKAQVVVFDEPTAGLGHREAETILAVIEDYARRGAAIVFVTHKLHEIMQIATDVSVIRDGRIEYGGERAQMTLDAIVGAVSHRANGRPGGGPGAPGVEPGDGAPTTAGEPCRIGLTSAAAPGLSPTTMECRPGEVVLLTGTDDSGVRTTGRVLAGLSRLTAGHVLLGGRTVRSGRRHAFMKAGVGYAPEDRKRTGIFPDLSVEDNIALGRISAAARFGVVRKKAVRERVRELIRVLDIVTENSAAHARGLSGGNQQKLLVARWLFANAQSIVLEEPTHGVDVGAIAAMHEILRDSARAGRTIVIVSREAAEFLAISDRTLVFWNGTTVKAVSAGASKDEVELAMAGELSNEYID